METRTIGKFITALRKANGMTQKELAEKLNVSDKTVSRWEREEGAPDLSLIPVLAEIFGVTCDELLRGQRRSPEEREAPEQPAPKGDKQRRHLLNASLSRYRNGCYIALGINAAGLLGAMICNLGFLRAYIGFFVACAFFAASAVCQAIFLNGCLSAVSGEEPSGELTQYRLAAARLGKTTLGTTLMLLGAVLPLILLPDDTYMGLSGASWFLYGLLFAGILLLLWCGACHFINGWLVNKGYCPLEPQAEAVFRANRNLKRRCAGLLTAAFLLTFYLQLGAGSIWSPWNLAKGIEFDSYDSFIAYMEQAEPVHYSDGTVAQPVPSDSIWYDDSGSEISAEEALREELYISDGTPEGTLVCTYIHRNFNVVSIRPAQTEDGLPITVVTHRDMQAAQTKNLLINLAFIPLYLAELAAVLLFYRKKRQ